MHFQQAKAAVKSAGVPFQRVDGEYWSQQIIDDSLRDNSCTFMPLHLFTRNGYNLPGSLTILTYSYKYADEGTFGSAGVGSKANNILIKVRGKDFTKAKNKGKRSTYMCGEISMGSNSYKFE